MCILHSMFFLFFSVHFFPVPFIGLPITSQNAIKKIQKSKIQTPDQKASKRVCPTRVCPTLSAQQLRPQRLKHLNPLLPFILMNKLSCLPHIFPVIKAVVFFSVPFIGFPITPQNTPQKKTARVPFSGPFPVVDRSSPL